MIIKYNEYIGVIQAGGRGTRMRELTGDKIPKPMLEIAGKPMIQLQIESMMRYGITDFVIILGHLGNVISDFFGDGRRFGCHIEYVSENEPLGSAGALFYLKKNTRNKDVLLVFSDVMFEMDLERMITHHKGNKACITVLAHPNSHPYDSDILLTKCNRVVGIDSKNNVRDYWYKNLVNAGIYILDKSVINSMDRLIPRDMEKDVILPLIEAGENVCFYRTTEYVKDAGTPDRYKKVCKEKENGLWEEKCLANKQKCVFLDRDGTINVHKGLIFQDEDIELYEGVEKAIKLFNENGFLAIVVTNQPVVARGLCSVDVVEDINNKIETLLGQKGAYLDDIVFCPHHPDKGYPEENPVYKIVCNCRKPKTGMIKEMVNKYNIDLENSYMVGDTTVDIKTGENAGVHTILLKTGEAGKDGKYEIVPEHTYRDLLEAANFITGKEK